MVTIWDAINRPQPKPLPFLGKTTVGVPISEPKRNIFQRSASWGIQQSGRLMRNILFGAPMPQGKRIMPFVSPVDIVPAAKVPEALGGIGKVAKSVKTYFARQLVNPFADTSIKAGFSKYGKKILGGTVLGAGAAVGGILSYSGVTGNIKNVKKAIEKGVLIGAGFGFSPLGALGGILSGAGTIGKEKIAEAGGALMNIPPPTIDIPSIPQFDLSDIKIPDYPAMAPISLSSEAPSLSISGGFGGGQDNTALMLSILAAGAGGLGYYLGRKRKKKKKGKKYKGGKR